MPNRGDPLDAGLSSPDPGADPRNFCTTHWSLVLRAGDLHSRQRDNALEVLCRSYWFPLYAFVRRRGHDEEEAKDLTQGFFERLLEKNYLANVDRSRGRFRTFLLAALKHYLANEWDRASARKRGGGQPLVSLDEADAEGRYREVPDDGLTPEMAFDRRWAEAVLERAFQRLRGEFATDEGRGGERFDAVKPFLLGTGGVPATGDGPAPGYAEAAARLGLTESGIRSIVHRLRRRFREVMREEIAGTVDDPAEIDAEIRALLTALS